MKGGATMQEGKEYDQAKEARLAAQRAYYRKWRAANKDKLRQYNRTYWDKKAQHGKEVTKEGG